MPAGRAGRHGRGIRGVAVVGVLLLALVVVTSVLLSRDREAAAPPHRRLVASAVPGATSNQLLELEGRLVGRDAVVDPATGRLPDVAAFHRAGVETLTVEDGRLEVGFLPDASADQRERALEVLLGSPTVSRVSDQTGGGAGDGFRDTWDMGDVEAAMAAAVGPGTGIPGAIALVSTPDHVWASGVGVAAVRDDEPMSPALPFRIGSTTKAMTAVLVLRLVADGRIALDDPVSDHLPGTLPYERPITVRELLSHTSGLVDASHFGARNVVPERDVPRVADPALRAQGLRALERQQRGVPVVVSPAVQVAVATTRPLAFRPGSRFAYSNTDYLALSMMVERVTGQPLATVMEREVFGPLGMGDTFLATTPALRGAHVHSYVVAPGGRWVDATDDLAFGASGSGAVVSTAQDLTVFFRALHDGRLLPESIVDEMVSPVPDSAMSDVMTAYGLGLTRYATPCGRTAWGHGGVIGGYMSSVYSSLDGDTVAVFLATSDRAGAVRDEITGRLFCAALGAG